jgi:hypothetical protein
MDNKIAALIDRKRLFTFIGIFSVLMIAFSAVPAGLAQAKTAVIENSTTYSFKINPPENLTATAITSTQITLQWEDKSDTEIRYKVERKSGRGNYFELALLGVNAYTYTDINLIPGTTYYYRVQVMRSPWETAYSNEASTTTPLPPVAAPEPQYPGNSFLVSTLKPRFKWSEVDTAATYTLQVALDNLFIDPVINESGIHDAFFEVANDLNWQKVYFWRVQAVDNEGKATDWSVVTSFTINPDPFSLQSHCGCGH